MICLCFLYISGFEDFKGLLSELLYSSSTNKLSHLRTQSPLRRVTLFWWVFGKCSSLLCDPETSRSKSQFQRCACQETQDFSHPPLTLACALFCLLLGALKRVPISYPLAHSSLLQMYGIPFSSRTWSTMGQEGLDETGARGCQLTNQTVAWLFLLLQAPNVFAETERIHLICNINIECQAQHVFDVYLLHVSIWNQHNIKGLSNLVSCHPRSEGG